MSESNETTKHTPGPWMLGDTSIPVIYAEKHVVALAENEPDLGAPVGEQWANARLIAAAPDLLAACQTAAAHLKWYLDRGYSTYINDRAVFEKLSAAITLATAQPQPLRDHDVAQPHPASSSA